MDKNNFDVFEMMKQAVDIQFDKMMLEVIKDNPFMLALFKLLNEYGIHGLRAHEFVMKFAALGGIMGEGEKDD